MFINVFTPFYSYVHLYLLKLITILLFNWCDYRVLKKRDTDNTKYFSCMILMWNRFSGEGAERYYQK